MLITLGIVFTVLVAWLSCGYAAGGIWLAYFQRKWPDLAPKDLGRDRRGAREAVPFGLIALLVLCFKGDYKYGLIWNWPWCSDTRSK